MHSRAPHSLACAVAVGLAALTISPRGSSAQPAGPGVAPAPGEPRPWADGVPADEQTIALGFYQEGNDDFLKNRFAQALAHYRAAIAHWDHPAIRFNMAVCLINLDQPLAAHDELERAMRYGAAPLGDDVFVQAQTYRKLLEGQLARLTLRCDLAGADVSLDGKQVLTGPGEVSSYLAPGEHQIVASRAGYLTASERVTLLAGRHDVHDVNLFVLTDAPPMVTARRWAVWKPYAVVAGGVALAVAGGLVHARAVDDFAGYDDGIRAACPRGCSAAERAALTDLADLDARAGRERDVAIALFATGAAAIAAGTIGLVLNQPRARALGPPEVTPLPGGAALAVGGRF